MTTARIAILLWRRGGPRQWTVLGLTAAGVVAATVVALLALSVSPALGARGDRIAWQEPAALSEGSSGPATAVQRTTTESFRGQVITRVGVAPTGFGSPPVPPGLDRLPGPGEIAVTPALAELMASEPATALADRYPGTVTSTIGPAGRASSRDLTVVVGRPIGALDGLGTPVAGFASSGTAVSLRDHQVMSQMAAVLLVVPTVLLVGALARLTAAQREQRLAALRLAGATPGLVVRITALETALAALVGAVAGVVTYLAVLPSAARIPLAGDRFIPADLRLGTGALALVLALVPVLAAASATVALRRVVIGPLGVRSRVRGRRPRLVRLLALPAAWILLVTAAGAMRDGGGLVPVLIGLGAVIGTFAVVGPWVTWLVGLAMARLARRPAPMVAGRRIVDDARGTYRTVSGMVLAGLIAGFLFGVLPTIRFADDQLAVVDGLPEATEMSIWVDGVAGEGPLAGLEPGLVQAVDEAVARAGAHMEWGGGSDESGRGGIAVAPEGADIEAVRTAVLAVAPEAWTSVRTDDLSTYTVLVDDMGRASVVMSLAAMALATVATAIGSTASILDQRVTLSRLRLAGTSLGALQSARRWQAMVPLALAGIGALASGALASQLLMAAMGADPAEIRPPDLAPMAGLGLAALVAGALVVAATRPVLVAATRAAPRE